MNNEFRHVNTIKVLIARDPISYFLSFLHAIGHQAPIYHTEMSLSYSTEADPKRRNLMQSYEETLSADHAANRHLKELVEPSSHPLTIYK